ncbi:MAG: alpha-2-macroglobulin [Candidatus Krumholzibacteriia bacterium]
MKKIHILILIVILSVPGTIQAQVEADWDTLQVQLNRGLPREALGIAGAIREKATARKDHDTWTRALVEEARLNLGLQAVETAAENLMAGPWPDDPHSRDVLNLVKARLLLEYFNRYSWRLRNGIERTDPDPADLSTWSDRQVAEAIDKALISVWENRLAWDSRGLEGWELYLEQNNYPARVRGTLRDAVTYLWAGFLTDSSLWSPRQNVQAVRLDLEQLMDADRDLRGLDRVADPETHPLERLTLILADLRQWHLGAGRPEAAHEAQLELLSNLRDHFPNLSDQIRLRQKLESLQSDLDPALPWWSFGQWRLAEFHRRENQPGSLGMAHLAAQKGARRHPEAIGGKLCARIVEEIEAPALWVEAMSQDAAGKRSILLRHKNLKRVYLRAWRFDREEADPLHRRLLDPPSEKEILAWINSGEYDLAWSVDLPVTEDFRSHQTYTGLPDCAPGPYVVVASVREDFQPQRNEFTAMQVLVSDLVLQTSLHGGQWEVQALSGETGQPLAGVELEVIPISLGRRIMEPSFRLRSDQMGKAVVSLEGEDKVMVLGRLGDDLALVNRLRPDTSRPNPVRQQCFLYTDRSVYRPGEVVSWKAVLYVHDREYLDHRVQPHREFILQFKDPNQQEIGSFTGRTNRFGSASGQFTVPESGLLGRWMLEIPGVGKAQVRVEEFKRPTFEAELDDPAGQPRLNRPVNLTGRAVYYFGQPVTEGQVTWTVTRNPVFKPWARRRPEPGGKAILASGSGSLKDDGTFAITFTPEADPRLDGEEAVSYVFRVEADVTAPGGEIRTATRSYRLGFVSVEASLSGERQFLLAGQEDRLLARRTNLDGSPQPGAGRWRLLALDQPAVTPLPADLPVEFDPRAFVTRGDTLRPRWNSHGYGLQQISAWRDGQEIATGGAVHGDDGRAEILLPPLPAGAYRLRYETDDDQGHSAQAVHDFVVAGRRRTPLAMPLVLVAETGSVRVGNTARVLVHSGLTGQPLRLRMIRNNTLLRDEIMVAGQMDELLEIPVTEDLRGGFSLYLQGLRDFQQMQQEVTILVPWDNMDLNVEFLTFRDRITPGAAETIKLRVTGPDSQAVTSGAVEVLAYMYDRSLDLFAAHNPPRPFWIFSQLPSDLRVDSNLGRAAARRVGSGYLRGSSPGVPHLHPDKLKLYPRRSADGLDPAIVKLLSDLDIPIAPVFEVEGAEYMVEVKSAVTERSVTEDTFEKYAIDSVEDALARQGGVVARAGELFMRGGRSGDLSYFLDGVPDPDAALRENFSPTAFFAPHVELDDEGTAVIEYQVPDAVTDWTVWAHALTPDLRSGSAHRNTSSLKDLLVRPYLPRFLREGDRAVLKVLVDNAGENELGGKVQMQLTDPETGRDVSRDFGFTGSNRLERSFKAPAGQSAVLSFDLVAPRGCGQVTVQVVARAANQTDGERHLLPVLPARTHLMQSRFVALDGKVRREMSFPLMSAGTDPTLTSDQLVVTVDAQLFQGVLAALPYLRDYPYECTEQTLNRFLGTAMVAGVFAGHPAVKEMAAKLSGRETRLPAWQQDDPNRRLQLEETPWLVQSRGGGEQPGDLINLLDPATVAGQQQEALARLRKIQDPAGGFAWWPGGRPSPYLTLYVLQGLSRAGEFGVDIPGDLAASAWRYLHVECLGERVDRAISDSTDWTLLTFLNYLLSGLDAGTQAATGFTGDERRLMLDLSFRHWREHSRLLKGQLALTLLRDGRDADARLVMASVMDGLISDPELGAWWAPEDRAWLWYNDTVEAHAFVLRVLSEVTPEDGRRHDLVKWLLLNRKLGHWKSTRATAEVIYALVHYLEQEGALGVPERIAVLVGDRTWNLEFDPADYTGTDNHWVVPGPEVDPRSMATVVVEKSTPGLAFAAATWHFSTDNPPAQADGDLLGVTRSFFRRCERDGLWVLEPLGTGEMVEVGDQVVVQLDITALHAAEFVHLRDPRAAGFEPERMVSGYRRDGGVGHYFEVRDSGANFFFDRLPAGVCTLEYRLRATMAGDFGVAPAQLQSMYAPEFTAHSTVGHLEVKP